MAYVAFPRSSTEAGAHAAKVARLPMICRSKSESLPNQQDVASFPEFLTAKAVLTGILCAMHFPLGEKQENTVERENLTQVYGDAEVFQGQGRYPQGFFQLEDC